jgi:putative phosphoesterase
MTIRAGVLSDTHIQAPTTDFIRAVEHYFADCTIIIHAGDIVDSEVLRAFQGKEIHAVHGNMCSRKTASILPRSTTFQLGNFTIGLTHGADLGYDIESRLWELFPEADCMIYGHTHRPVCHRIGTTLIMNPGSFRATSPYGATGTFGILEADDTLHGSIHETVR